VLLTVAVVIVARFVWVFPAIYLPRRLARSLRAAIRLRPGSGSSFLRSSACAASSRWRRRWPFPLTTLAGAPFAYRDLILFVTFGVLGPVMSSLPEWVTPPSSRFCPWSAPRPPHYAVRRNGEPIYTRGSSDDGHWPCNSFQLHRPGDGTSGSRGLCSARLRLVFLLDQPCAAIGFVSAQR
jgi:hypothetical protein